MTDVIQIATTTAERADAERIALALVERRLAGCVQISGPVASTYRWEGSIETSTEWLCTIKTRAAMFDRVREAIAQMHPYDEPEIIALPVVAGSRGYLQWLESEVPPAAEFEE